MLETERKGSRVRVALRGEIDHCAAQTMKKEIDFAIRDRQIKTLLLDFADVSFMDSSGVGMLIGRYRIMNERGGKVFAVGLAPLTEKLFRMAGLHRIISIGGDEGRETENE